MLRDVYIFVLFNVIRNIDRILSYLVFVCIGIELREYFLSRLIGYVLLYCHWFIFTQLVQSAFDLFIQGHRLHLLVCNFYIYLCVALPSILIILDCICIAGCILYCISALKVFLCYMSVTGLSLSHSLYLYLFILLILVNVY